MPRVTTITATAAAFLAAALYLLAPNHAAIPAYSDQLHCHHATYLPTPTYGIRGAALTLCAEAVIEGRLTDVYDAILDFHRYDTWNQFVIHVDGLPSPSSQSEGQQWTLGTSATLRVQGLMPAGVQSSTNIELSVLQPPPADAPSSAGAVAVNAWKSTGTPEVLLRTEHPNILTDLGDGTVRYVSYETMYGPMAWLVRLLLGRRLQAQFELQAHNLKEYVESRY